MQKCKNNNDMNPNPYTAQQANRPACQSNHAQRMPYRSLSAATDQRQDWYRAKSLELMERRLRYQRRQDDFKRKAQLMREQQSRSRRPIA